MASNATRAGALALGGLMAAPGLAALRRRGRVATRMIWDGPRSRRVEVRE